MCSVLVCMCGHVSIRQFLPSILPNGLFAHITGREEGVWGQELANGGAQDGMKAVATVEFSAWKLGGAIRRGGCLGETEKAPSAPGLWPDSVKPLRTRTGALHSAVKACPGKEGCRVKLEQTGSDACLQPHQLLCTARLLGAGGRKEGVAGSEGLDTPHCICASLSRAGPGQFCPSPLRFGLYILSLNIAARQLWAFNCPELLLTLNEGRKWEGK